MSALVLGQLLAPPQLALDSLADELGHAVRPDKRLYALAGFQRQPDFRLFHVHRWSAHAALSNRPRQVCQKRLLRANKRPRLLTIYPSPVITSITNRLETVVMANIKYFSGENELSGVYHDDGKFFGYVSKEDLVFVAGKGWTGYVKADRVVEYKSNPSRHECDARCLNATGRVMKCECSCGGKNHGRGSFICAEAA